MYDSHRDGFKTGAAHRESSLWRLEATVDPELTVVLQVQYPYPVTPHAYRDQQEAEQARHYILRKLIEAAATKALEELDERFPDAVPTNPRAETPFDKAY